MRNKNAWIQGATIFYEIWSNNWLCSCNILCTVLLLLAFEVYMNQHIVWNFYSLSSNHRIVQSHIHLTSQGIFFSYVIHAIFCVHSCVQFWYHLPLKYKWINTLSHIFILNPKEFFSHTLFKILYFPSNCILIRNSCNILCTFLCTILVPLTFEV